MMLTKKSKQPLDNVHVLIADGDGNIAHVLAQNLRAMGLRNIYQVRNGHAALEYIAAHQVDILITEWEMDKMSGIELVNHIRRDPNSLNRMMPIIMLTGKGEEPDVEQARDTGITEFVVKPFTAK